MIRFFTGPLDLFDSMRLQVMAILGQPNGAADEPWPAGVNHLALGPHHHEPPQYAALIDYALANGAHEISEADYLSLYPPSPTS